MILSGEMMLRHLGWGEAADLIVKGMDGGDRREAGHLRLRAADGRRDELKTSEFADAIIANM